MNSIKSTGSRVLRCNLTPLITTRGITGTTRKSTSLESSQNSQHSTPFIPQEFLSHRPQHTQLTRPHKQANAFTSLITALTTSLTTTPHPNLHHLTTLLHSYTSNPAHWSRYAHANPSKQYTRNVVHSVPGLFNLLILVWTPGKRSAVHDHADAHCLMKILKGGLVERRFALPDGSGEGNGGKMRETSKLLYETGKVAYMCDRMGLHEIHNPCEREYAVSLHLYTPPNAATRGCRVFDEHTGKSRHVMQSAWDSVDGVPT